MIWPGTLRLGPASSSTPLSSLSPVAASSLSEGSFISFTAAASYPLHPSSSSSSSSSPRSSFGESGYSRGVLFLPSNATLFYGNAKFPRSFLCKNLTASWIPSQLYVLLLLPFFLYLFLCSQYSLSPSLSLQNQTVNCTLNAGVGSALRFSFYRDANLLFHNANETTFGYAAPSFESVFLFVVRSPSSSFFSLDSFFSFVATILCAP
jgi:hypothetical protein